MNQFRDEIIRTVADRESAPLGEYYYPSETGSFTGILRYRCWHKNKPMLLCYFDADDGNRYVLPAWWQSWGVSYYLSSSPGLPIIVPPLMTPTCLLISPSPFEI